MQNQGEETDTGHLPTERQLGAYVSLMVLIRSQFTLTLILYVYECWIMHICKCTTRIQCLEVQKRVSDPLGLFMSFHAGARN